MKEQIIELMEKTLSAYTNEHIQRYFNDVKTNGLTEHGFPRLTSNIGILIANGRRCDLLGIFLEMMEFCCEQIPKVKAANEFSIREIICCIWELESAGGIVCDEDILRWKDCLASVNPEKCYNSYEESLAGKTRNWAIFMTVSELFREKAGLRSNVRDFIDIHLEKQMKWIDDNGMYRDNIFAENQQPVMYDLVTRGLFVFLLSFGYRGKYYEQIDEYLKKSALLTLKMQSPNGEAPFGGRSNQFLHNEAWLITVYGYEINRYEKEGNKPLAATFRTACTRALKVTQNLLSKTPILHIKNRFPTETKYGCEDYAYFDKYMITVASILYMAYLVHYDSATLPYAVDYEQCAAVTSQYFHKLFLKSGGYGLEFDLEADPHYDANGLGRVHRDGAPPSICMSCPCPESPEYTVDISPIAFSACSAVLENDTWKLGAEEGVKYEVLEYSTDISSAFATLACRFETGKCVQEHYTVNENGVKIALEGDGKIAFSLPAFCFDGEKVPEIVAEKHTLTIGYEGWVCRYTTSGEIVDLNKIAANRNGHYHIFIATSENNLNVKIEIIKQ